MKHMENKKTAVEWLIEQTKSKEWQDMFIWHKEEVFEQAKAMEKKQIIDAANGYTQIHYVDVTHGEKYYNEKYGK